MRLNRAQSIYVAIGILVVVFAVGLLFLRSDRRMILASRPSPTPSIETPSSAAPLTPIGAAQQSSAAASVEAEPGHNSLFTMNDFHRSETKDGRTVWEVNGSKGEYFPQSNSAKIQNAKLKMYDKQGKISELTTREAEIYLDGPSLGRAHGRMGVTVIHHGDTTLTTEEADYDRTKGLIATNGPVKITGSKADITANKLEGNVDAQTFTLSGDVVTIIKPRLKDKTK